MAGAIAATWHDDVEECLWFALFAAHTDAVLAVLDMTKGMALPHIQAYLDTLAAGANE
ncbi:hypothetical protein GCM10011495_31250 [Hymenobacter frigidus]|uniref:Uncharacterized protein n=1 Tax=Hymenobacter frigidus TaxID=1524095 RepID=A0ABQ2AA00_9BACT|nr:hypothetical protein [Hymenobacter frigidus]GGH88902.1 hypothetical protein GCM10011495_31250 [Hymenobacter frigidus]